MRVSQEFVGARGMYDHSDHSTEMKYKEYTIVQAFD